MKAPGNISARCGRLLLGAAALLSLYLASMALGRTALPGCGDASACQDVMQSRWAYAFGIPVSFPGFVMYSAALLLSGAYVRGERSLAGLEGGIALGAVIAGALWFTALQVFVLQTLCVWCSAAHGLAITGTFLLWCSRRAQRAFNSSTRRRARDEPRTDDRIFRYTAAGAVLAGTGLLALGAIYDPLQSEPAAESTFEAAAVAPAGENDLALLGGKFHLRPDDYPVIGSRSPEARTAVLLSDYTCEWCRDYHATIENLAASARPPLRIIVLPVARTPEAAAIQRTLLTLFHSDAGAWSKLSALLTSGQIPASPAAADDAARKLLSAETRAGSELANADIIEAQLQLAAAILEENRSRSGGSGTLPQLMRGHRILTGAEHDRARLLAFFDDPAGGPVATSRQPPAPSMKLVNSSVQLDTVQPGKPQDFSIKVSNNGTATLHLGWISLDSGCEVTHMPDKKIFPGEVCIIGFRITVPAGTGAFSRTLKIHSDAPGPPCDVIIRGAAAGRVAASP